MFCEIVFQIQTSASMYVHELYTKELTDCYICASFEKETILRYNY